MRDFTDASDRRVIHEQILYRALDSTRDAIRVLPESSDEEREAVDCLNKAASILDSLLSQVRH